MVESITPVVEQTTDSDRYGRFTIEPLEGGFGLTIGNTLRRVLLSALPGAAITSVKIEGVAHEFSTIPGVKEDSIDFLLNIKGIRIRPLSDRTGVLTLDVSGDRTVTASDIVVSSDFEIVNPDAHIATLDGKSSRLSVEFNVDHGTGYTPGGSSSGLGIGVIAVDAIFTPVRKVNYVVETTRIGIDNYDRLIIEIWTDGTVTPADAMGKAASIMVGHFTNIAEIGRSAGARLADRQPLSSAPMPQKQYETPIEDLDLSVRAYNCLKRAGITKVGQIVEMSEEDLLNVRNFGRKSLDELRDKLVDRGFITADRFQISGSYDDAEDDVDEDEADAADEE